VRNLPRQLRCGPARSLPCARPAPARPLARSPVGASARVAISRALLGIDLRRARRHFRRRCLLFLLERQAVPDLPRQLRCGPAIRPQRPTRPPRSPTRSLARPPTSSLPSVPPLLPSDPPSYDGLALNARVAIHRRTRSDQQDLQDLRPSQRRRALPSAPIAASLFFSPLYDDTEALGVPPT
jgi:hypothetical protein